MRGLTGPLRQVPPVYSAVQVGGRRAYQMARAGQEVELAARDVVVHALDLLEWDAAEPARPVAVVDVHCSAGTYVRALARDLGARLDTGAYLGALVRTASGGFRLEDAVALDTLREHAADGPVGVAGILLPVDAGLEDLPHARVTADEIRRLGEGLITAPKTPLPTRDADLVLAVGPDGVVVAVCRAVAGALYPHKVLAVRPATDGRPDPRDARLTVRVARGLGRLHASDHAAFIVVGVFDGLHLGHQYLLEQLVGEAARRDARPMVVTFDHHPDEIITGSAPPLLCDPDERFARMEAAGVETVVVVHFDQALRETTYDAFVAQLAARGPLAGFLMTPDAAFGFQRGGTPDALAELGRARGFEVVVVPPFALDGRQVRSTEVRAAIADGELDLAARLLGRLHTVIGEAVPDGEGSAVRFGLPVALPPDGGWEAMVEADGLATFRSVAIEGGRLRVAGDPVNGRARIAFVRRAAGGELHANG